MKLYLIQIVGHRLLRSWQLAQGAHLLGCGKRCDLVLDRRVCPQDILCKVESLPGLVTVTAMGEAPLHGADGNSLRVQLRCGDTLTVGDFKLVAMEEEELPDFLVGDAPVACAPTAESDGVVPPAKEPLLALVRGERGTQTVPLRQGLVVGRDKGLQEAGIRLTHAAVSAKHAVFTEELDGFYLEDLGSDHGTFLNGVEIERGERKRLSPDSVVRFTRNSQVPRIEIASLAQLRKSPPQDMLGGALVGDSLAMQKIRALARQLGPERLSVYIHAESGSGKELVAGLLAWEYNPKKPITVADCATLAPSVIDVELFGYVKGAFTDAKEEKRGLVDEAEGGVLFFDEIGDLPLPLQAKLLRLIEAGEFRRVGGTAYLRANARFVFATHRNLEQMVAAGTFRHDLFERIKGVRLDLPPLRDHKEDIGAITAHYLDKRGSGPKRTLAGGAVAALHGYDWPGNVRELLRAVEVAAVRTPGGGEIAETTVREVLAEFQAEPPGDSSPELIRDAPARVEAFEKSICAEGLARAGGNWKKAAKELGYAPTNLHRRLKAWGLLKAGVEETA